MRTKHLSEFLSRCRSVLMQGLTDIVFNDSDLKELSEALASKGYIEIVKDYGYCKEIRLVRYDKINVQRREAKWY